MSATMQKEGGVRGIATGTSFRRLARQFGKQVKSVCSPFQFALSTRAGKDCVSHAIRWTTDTDHEATVRWHRSMRPRASQCHDGQIAWRPKPQVKHVILQAEGGEQGDPLMPLLFFLAVHDALANVQMQLRRVHFREVFCELSGGATLAGIDGSMPNFADLLGEE